MTTMAHIIGNSIMWVVGLWLRSTGGLMALLGHCVYDVVVSIYLEMSNRLRMSSIM